MPKYRIILFVFLFLSFYSIGQKSACTNGEMRILSGSSVSSQEICFVKETKVITENYFFTKYIIQRSGDEVYEVDFKYFKKPDSDIDSVAISILDKLNIKVKSVSITFSKVNDCFSIIRNYHVNDKDIDDTAYVSILFNIPNETDPYVNLNVFKDISEETYYFLQKIPLDVRMRHDSCVNLKISDCNKLKKEFTDNEKAIDELKKKMNAYKADQLKRMDDEIETTINRPATYSASPEMQESFTKKLDKMFLNQFGNYYSFENNDIDAEFTFRFNGNGNLKGIDPTYKNGSQQIWFIDTLNQKIKPLIEMENIPAIPGKYTQTDLITGFNNKFNDSTYEYNNTRKKNISAVHNCDSTYILPDNSRGAFNQITNDIVDAFTPFISKPINLPTAYWYKYRYTTTVTEVTGVWKNEKNEFDIKQPIGSLPTVLQSRKDEISWKFKEIFAPGSRQKYHIQICSLTINGEFIGLDMKKLE
jgi:hypothetical protein